MRSTLYNVPCNQDMLKESQIPLAVVTTPFAKIPKDEVIQTIVPLKESWICYGMGRTTLAVPKYELYSYRVSLGWLYRMKSRKFQWRTIALDISLYIWALPFFCVLKYESFELKWNYLLCNVIMLFVIICFNVLYCPINMHDFVVVYISYANCQSSMKMKISNSICQKSETHHDTYGIFCLFSGENVHCRQWPKWACKMQQVQGLYESIHAIHWWWTKICL